MDRIPESLGQIAPQLVALAVVLLGSSEEVQRELRCSLDDLAQPTQVQLETLFAIIVREQAALVGTNRDLLDRIRSRMRPQ
jgi:hypothetical protein